METLLESSPTWMLSAPFRHLAAARPLLPPPASNLQPAACALPPGSLNGTILPVTSAPSRLHRNFCPLGQSESSEGPGGEAERGASGAG